MGGPVLVLFFFQSSTGLTLLTDRGYHLGSGSIPTTVEPLDVTMSYVIEFRRGGTPLNILDVVELVCQGVRSADGDDLPVELAVVNHGVHAQRLHLPVACNRSHDAPTLESHFSLFSGTTADQMYASEEIPQ